MGKQRIFIWPDLPYIRNGCCCDFGNHGTYHWKGDQYQSMAGLHYFSDWKCSFRIFHTLGIREDVSCGLLTVYIIAPTTVGAVDYLSPIVLEALALFVLFIFAVDLTLTVTALLHFDRMVARMEDSFNHRMEVIVDNTFTQSNKIKESMLRQGRFVSGQVSTLS